MKYFKLCLKALCLGLTSLLILPTLSCGKDAPAATSDQADTPTPTAPADTSTGTETAPAQTEEPYGWLADEEARRAATESVPANDVMLGCWVTPRPHLMTTQEDADARYAEIRESGINMVYSFWDTYDPAHMDRMLRAAEKNGIRVMIELNRISDASGIDANLELVKATMDYPAVIGYNMYDEPNAALYTVLGEQLRRIREVVGEDKLIMCNLFPNYASATQLGSVAGKDGETAYQQYLDGFMSKVNSDILSFDYYPFRIDGSADTDRIKGMLVNFSDITLCARAYDVPTWGFVQNSSWSGTRIPNDNELRFLTHAHLIFGLESYSYFLYSQPSNVSGAEGIFEGMLTYDGERTDIYDRVKANNEALSGMRGRYLDYTLHGFLTDNLSRGYRASIADELKLDTFGVLTSVESDGNILIGCFENGTDTAYYVMNFNYAIETTVTLTLGDGAPFTLWGADGIEQMGEQKTVTVDLLPGEGKFMEMKTYSVD